jgi:SAM-dependent methyltransferase
VEATLELLTEGRPVRLRYVEEPPWLYLVASGSETLWPSAVLRTGRADWIRDGRRGSGRADLVTDDATRTRILHRFRAEAGPEHATDWYALPGRLIAVRTDRSDDEAEPYGRWLRAEFDRDALEYERRVEGNPVERRFRRRSVDLLVRTFGRPGRLLEIGSGVGLETVPLLRLGHRILAVDVSSQMLDRLRARASAEGWDSPLETRVLRAKDLSTLVVEYGAASFDGAFSTFGALNLEPDLTPVARALGRLVRPGGFFVAGVFNRHAVLEPLASVAAGRVARALARAKRPVPVGSHRFSVDLHLRSVREMKEAFANGFTLRRVEGLGVVLPPPDLATRLDSFGVRWDRLDRWDTRLGMWSTLAGAGDQFLAVFERNGAA